MMYKGDRNYTSSLFLANGFRVFLPDFAQIGIRYTYFLQKVTTYVVFVVFSSLVFFLYWVHPEDAVVKCKTFYGRCVASNIPTKFHILNVQDQLIPLFQVYLVENIPCQVWSHKVELTSHVDRSPLVVRQSPAALDAAIIGYGQHITLY